MNSQEDADSADQHFCDTLQFMQFSQLSTSPGLLAQHATLALQA